LENKILEQPEGKNTVKNANQTREEFDFLNLLSILWRWKYLIIAGTIFCAVASAIISHSLTKIYRVGVDYEIGVAEVAGNGKAIYAIDPQSLKSLILRGVFNKAIREKIKSSDGNIKSGNIQFRVSYSRNTNNLKVTFDTPNVDQGIVTLMYLTEAVRDKYSGQIDTFRNAHQNKIDRLKSDILVIDAEENHSNIKSQYIGRRLEELSSQIGILRDNIEALKKQRDHFSAKNNMGDQGSINALMNDLQLNLSLKNDYDVQFDALTNSLEEEKINRIRLREDRKVMISDIDLLEKEKDRIKAIDPVNGPTASQNPIRPKIKLNIALATISGFIGFFLLSLFVDYLFKIKKSVQNSWRD
jgi:uncharacterized protein involved in exopolysaccharide biosynthesis